MFCDELEVVHIRFLLCAVAFHMRNTPASGHYKALVLQDDDFYVADDGGVAEVGEMAQSLSSAVALPTYSFTYRAPSERA